MKPVVPFLSEADSVERAEWQRALPEGLKDFAEVKPFAALSEEERANATVAIVANPDPAQVAALPSLEWVQSLWAGVERLAADLPVDGPAIVRLVDPQMADTMSEAVLAWTLYLHRDMPAYMAQQRDAVWRYQPLKTPLERTIGMLGLGKLGTASALRLKANGFNVLGWSRTEKDIEDLECHSGETGLQTVLKQADILVLLMPLTAETRGLIGSKVLSACKQGASLINFARGPIVDISALFAALDENRLSHAVLDVFDKEPLDQASPLWQHPKITILPHISAPTITSTATSIVAKNLSNYFETGEIPHSVDRKKGY